MACASPFAIPTHGSAPLHMATARCVQVGRAATWPRVSSVPGYRLRVVGEGEPPTEGSEREAWFHSHAANHVDPAQGFHSGRRSRVQIWSGTRSGSGSRLRPSATVGSSAASSDTGAHIADSDVHCPGPYRRPVDRPSVQRRARPAEPMPSTWPCPLPLGRVFLGLPPQREQVLADLPPAVTVNQREE
jgi:hypothetical protein